ncbi:MAG: hypothetical protein ACREPZ_08260 [Rhodanobacteraceae bacterium]
MDVVGRTGRGHAPQIHWLVRGVMWLLVLLFVAVPCFLAVAPFLHPAGPATSWTAWTAVELTGVICGSCVLGAGFLGTLAWRGHSDIAGVAWVGNHPVAPRLPWYTRAWAGIVCAGMLMLLIAQLHRMVDGDASWLSAFMTLVMVVVAFLYLAAPLVIGRWSEATIRFAPRLTMTPRAIHAAVKAEHDPRRGI